MAVLAQMDFQEWVLHRCLIVQLPINVAGSSSRQVQPRRCHPRTKQEVTSRPERFLSAMVMVRHLCLPQVQELVQVQYDVC
ncbi:MAG: hypothetical protein CM1200mP25_3220 [Acidobacteriota bacterium]|nr:MAG: hypothetical protein CM1200mP25_3220 [Acidobacteriota bacterium]